MSISKLKKLEYRLASSLMCKKEAFKEKLLSKDLGAKAPIVELLLLVAAAILIAFLIPNIKTILNTLSSSAVNKVNTIS